MRRYEDSWIILTSTTKVDKKGSYGLGYMMRRFVRVDEISSEINLLFYSFLGHFQNVHYQNIITIPLGSLNL